MSEQAERTVPFSEIATMLPRGGDFIEENRYGPDHDAPFVPWGRSSFKPAPDKKSSAPTKEESAAEEPTSEQQADPSDDAAETAPSGQTGQQSTGAGQEPSTAAAPSQRRQAAAPPPKPPPPPEPQGPSAEDIIAAIDQAREDGRALGYQQGVDATRREIGATLTVLKKLEAQITTLAQDAVERNADIMAHHVRRIAQDLFGAVFTEIPDVFLERIKNAAEMFTKAGAEFTLAMNPHDMLSLTTLMQETEIFEKIRIVEDDKLQPGAFHLSSRDLDYEDAPLLTDARGS
jgi:hypothetical protein